MRDRLSEKARKLEMRVRNLGLKKIEKVEGSYQKLISDIRGLPHQSERDYLFGFLERQYEQHYPRVRS
ncbi:hypothetical protein HYX17_03750 [Candidatus Woesearchaeota archaeon]|nr:hypothetical protein [Candidatus Woesearchaeota archaeon]